MPSRWSGGLAVQKPHFNRKGAWKIGERRGILIDLREVAFQANPFLTRKLVHQNQKGLAGNTGDGKPFGVGQLAASILASDAGTQAFASNWVAKIYRAA